MIEIKRFFEDYKTLENKAVVIESFLDRQDALRVIEESIRLYKKLNVITPAAKP